MKMWSMRIIILLLFCYACLSTDNQRVRFVSRNFNNVLHWDPVEPALENVTYTYSVWYWSDAGEQPFKKKEACQNTTALFCNLTAKTPYLHDVHYFAEVYVNGRFHGQNNKRFKPITDTFLGPPILSTRTTVTSLHVNVTLPSGPNGVSIADIITSSKNYSKPVVVYILKITHPEWAAQVNETTGNRNGLFVINLKNNKTQYHGYVVYKPCAAIGCPESENASFCVTLPDDPLKPLPWLLLSAALLVALVILSGVYMCNYVKARKEKSMPKHLVPTSSTLPTELESLDRNLKISKLVVCDKPAYTPILVMSHVPSVRVGYFPQDIPCQAWQDSIGSRVGTGAHSLTLNPEETSAQSSEIYSELVVHVPAEEKDFQQSTIQDSEIRNPPLSSSGESWNKGLKPTSHGDPDLWDSDPVGPLVLHTVRDNDGKLVLSSLTFQTQSNTGDTERKPLLSYLTDSTREGPSLASLRIPDSSEWSDSGCESTLNTPTQPYCNTDYSPSQPVDRIFPQGCQNTLLSNDATFESGYKQNWMPAILLGNSSTCE